MSFYVTSRNVTLDGMILRAECLDRRGKWHQSQMKLCDYLHNSLGRLGWRKSMVINGFGPPVYKEIENAKDLSLEGSILYARLPFFDGECIDSSLDLDRRIRNDNGQLVYCEPKLNFKENRANIDSREGKDAAIHGHFKGYENFSYNPLRTHSSIRLLEINTPTENPDVIQSTLTHVDLRDRDPPTFVALSYTWGNPFAPVFDEEDIQYFSKKTAIECNGKTIEIGQNLYYALRRLRNAQPTYIEKIPHRFNKTPLIECAEKGQLYEVIHLLRNGADVTAQDRFGKTALHYAAENSYLHTVRALVFAGSNLTTLDFASRTPLDYARQRCRKEIETFLVEQLNSNTTMRRNDTSLRQHITHAKYYWIDAICIDQANLQEKSIQVRMMGDIYKAAQSVIVWLGPCGLHDFQSTDDWLREIWRLEGARENGNLNVLDMEKMLSNPTRGPLESKISRFRLSAQEWLDTMKDDDIETWLVSLPLFHRNWFGRAWIIQEVMLASHITIVCGEFLVPWDIFIYMSCIVVWVRNHLERGNLPWRSRISRRTDAAASVSTGLFQPASQYLDIAINLERQRRAYRRNGEISMLNALLLSRSAQATDSRDKIFSVASITSLKQPTTLGLKPIVPNYDQTPMVLYVRTARALLVRYGLQILSLSGLQANQNKEIPSWVPGLQHNQSPVPRGINVSHEYSPSWNAAVDAKFNSTVNSIQTRFFTLSPEDHLYVRGYAWDTIGQVASSGLGSVGFELNTLSSWVNVVSNLNAPAEKNLQTLWRTLIEDLTATSFDSPPPSQTGDEDFKDWLLRSTLAAIWDRGVYYRRNVLRFLDGKEQFSFFNVMSPEPDAAHRPLLEKAHSLLGALTIPLVVPTDDVNQVHNAIDRFRLWSKCAPGTERFISCSKKVDTSRRLFRSMRWNRLGTAPEMAEVGDVIFYLLGTHVPYIFRKKNHGRYQLVGEAYIYGVPQKIEEYQGAVKIFFETGGSMFGENLCIV